MKLNKEITSDAPKTEIGLIQMIMMRKLIRHKWVKLETNVIRITWAMNTGAGTESFEYHRIGLSSEDILIYTIRLLRNGMTSCKFRQIKLFAQPIGSLWLFLPYLMCMLIYNRFASVKLS